MGAVEAIVILSLVGFLLLASEVFVPGLILGSLGIVCLGVAVGVSYANFGGMVGTLTLAGLGSFTLIGFVGWMFAFPHTVIGRKLILANELKPGNAIERHPLLGRDGRALTPLRPSGTAVIDGRNVDVLTEGDFISDGENVVVVRVEGQRVVVRKKV